MATPSDEMTDKLTWRRFEDGDHDWGSWTDKIFVADESYKCPTYVLSLIHISEPTRH